MKFFSCFSMNLKSRQQQNNNFQNLWTAASLSRSKNRFRFSILESFSEWANESLKDLDNLKVGFENTFAKKDKLMAEMLEEFKQYDVNGDGFVTRDEINEVMEKNSDKWGLFDFGFFEQLDENDDGKLSIEGNFTESSRLAFVFVKNRYQIEFNALRFHRFFYH